MTSRTIKRLVLVIAGALLPLFLATGAQADPLPDPLGFHFSSPAYVVNENAGEAVITVQRSPLESLMAAQIRYITLGDGVSCGTAECTAVSPIDFTSVKGELDFSPGQTSATFTVPIVDHGTISIPKTIAVSLFGPYPIGMGVPSKAILTILNSDLTPPRNPFDPLALVGRASATAVPGNPLAGARLFVDPQSVVANQAKKYPGLDVIAREPGTARFGSFSFGNNGVPSIAVAVSRYLARAQYEDPGSVPLLATPPPTRRPTTTSSRASRRGSGRIARSCSWRWTR